MKKLIILSVIAACIYLFVFFYRTNLVRFEQGRYLLYTTDEMGQMVVVQDDTDRQTLFSDAQVILGEGIYNLSSVELDSIKEQLCVELVSVTCLKDLKVYNYFSPKLEHFIVSNNKKVNLQVAVSADNIKIGYPLILDSF